MQTENKFHLLLVVLRASCSVKWSKYCNPFIISSNTK